MTDQTIRNLETLRAAIQNGYRPKYLFFWGHTPARPGQIDKHCLSQFWSASFEVEGQVYPTAEHFMMAEKARLFEDSQTLHRILAATHPGEAKKLGRQVAGFEEQLWAEHRFEIVVRGNVAKFGQNEALQSFLLNTKDRVLVEASPTDRIWGIGLAEADERAADPPRWLGLNLLGFALMVVRRQLCGE
jgi:ribA/ribD-fused uncharacterized protein